jgi:hypothetical protein
VRKARAKAKPHPAMRQYVCKLRGCLVGKANKKSNVTDEMASARSTRYFRLGREE